MAVAPTQWHLITPKALLWEIVGTFLLVYTVFSAIDPKSCARDSHEPVSNDFNLLHHKVNAIGILTRNVYFYDQLPVPL